MKNILFKKVTPTFWSAGAHRPEGRWYLLLLLFFLLKCSDDPKIEVKIERFDRDLIALDTANLSAGLDNLAKKYPQMLPLFAGSILRDPSNPAETPEQAVSKFLKAQPIRALFDSVGRQFPDLAVTEKSLGKMFGQYQKLFPSKPQPQVVAMVSEFGTDVFTAGDSLCGIGLDMFLGKNFGGYNPELFPEFIRQQFEPQFIPVRLAKALAQNAAPDLAGNQLLDHIIFQGKILFVAKKLLPDTPDSLLMNYSRAQMEGCFSNEKEVWARLLQQNLLFSSDFNSWRKVVTPSPNAPIVFEEAPGEIGSWVGWRIVESFMARNSSTSLDEMLRLTNSQQFLERAKYKPR